jgi:hypothetical protein
MVRGEAFTTIHVRTKVLIISFISGTIGGESPDTNELNTRNLHTEVD